MKLAQHEATIETDPEYYAKAARVSGGVLTKDKEGLRVEKRISEEPLRPAKQQRTARAGGVWDEEPSPPGYIFSRISGILRAGGDSALASSPATSSGKAVPISPPKAPAVLKSPPPKVKAMPKAVLEKEEQHLLEATPRKLCHFLLYLQKLKHLFQ